MLDGCNTVGYLMSVGEGNFECNVEFGVEYMVQVCRMGYEDGEILFVDYVG